MAKDKERACFVIAPIGQAGSPTRARSDKILKHVITPAAESRGYKTVRADKIQEPGVINAQIIAHIGEDPMVIADLTEHNANVFYELALRHALRKPAVMLIEVG